MADERVELEELRRLAELEKRAQMEHAPFRPNIGPVERKGPVGAGDVGLSLLSGFGKAVSQMPAALSYVLPMGKESAQGLQDFSVSTGKTYQNLGERSNLSPVEKTLLEGAGASPLAGSVNAPVRGAVAGAAGNLGSEVGGALAGTPGAVVGGVLAGGATGAAVSPRQNRSERAVRRASEGLSPADYEEASRLIDAYASTGAKTGTLADFLPGNNRILSLAIETRNSRGGERLSAQVAKREQDLADLNRTIVSRSGEPGVPAEVTNQAQAAAEAVLNRKRGERSANYQSDLAGVQPLDAAQVEQFRTLLLKQAAAAEPKVEKEAYLAAADALTSANKGAATKSTVVPGTPIGKKGFRSAATTTTETVPVDVPKVDISSIAKDLKQMQERANPLTATGGQTLDRGAVGRRYQEVQEFLKGLSPQYRKAEEGYQNFSRNQIDPLVGGPIGDLSGRNPNALADPSSSILSNILKDQTPESIPKIMETLGTGTELPSQLLPQISRALVAQKLQKGPLNAAGTLRGTKGSQEEANLQALLEAANVRAKPVTDALDVSEALQNFKNAPSGTGEAPMQSVGIRALTAADRFLGTKMQERYYRQIAELLASPTQESLRKLQEIAMFDPTIRKQLMLKGVITPTLQGEQ